MDDRLSAWQKQKSLEPHVAPRQKQNNNSIIAKPSAQLPMDQIYLEIFKLILFIFEVDLSFTYRKFNKYR